MKSTCCEFLAEIVKSRDKTDKAQLRPPENYIQRVPNNWVLFVHTRMLNVALANCARIMKCVEPYRNDVIFRQI